MENFCEIILHVAKSRELIFIVMFIINNQIKAGDFYSHAEHNVLIVRSLALGAGTLQVAA